MMILTKITDRLTKIEPIIDFTHERKTCNTLPFLEILLINNNKLEFKIHRQSPDKNNHILFYLDHNIKIKSEVILRFV